MADTQAQFEEADHFAAGAAGAVEAQKTTAAMLTADGIRIAAALDGEDGEHEDGAAARPLSALPDLDVLLLLVG